MRVRLLPLAIVLVVSSGCRRREAVPPPSSPASSSQPTTAAPAEAPSDSDARGAGAPPPPPDEGGVKGGGVTGAVVEINTKETPILACGPADSYKYVAAEFKCSDGSNPFNGNLKAAAAARVGNVGANSQGHIIDLYEVPCPEGPRRVYVDMYGCNTPPGGGGGGSKI